MSNLIARWRKVFPEPRLVIGTVVDSQGGVLSVELPGGAVVSARGSGALNTKVFVRNGVVEGAAPNLSVVLIEV